MSNKKLKRCPFCNGEAKVAELKFGLNAVYCDSCGAKITAFYMGNAIKAWNKRVDVECCEDENATCKENLQLTRSDIEQMVKLKCHRGGHMLYYYIQNDINLAIIYDADKNEYTVHVGNTYIHQIKTLENAKSKLKEIVVNFICLALGVEE
jgi:hypothetical protein